MYAYIFSDESKLGFSLLLVSQTLLIPNFRSIPISGVVLYMIAVSSSVLSEGLSLVQGVIMREFYSTNYCCKILCSLPRRFLSKFEAYENNPDYFRLATSSSSSSSLAPPTSSNVPPSHPLAHSLTAPHLHPPQASQSLTPSLPLSKATSTLPTFQRPGEPGDAVRSGGGKECDRIVRSLVSGFPNEVDFALNVLTMMSFEKPESVPITKVTQLTVAFMCGL